MPGLVSISGMRFLRVILSRRRGGVLMPLRFWGVHDEAALASVLVHDRGPVPFGRGFRFGGASVNGTWFAVLLIVLGLAVWRAIVEGRRR